LDRSTFGGFSDSFDRLGYTKAMTELLLEEGVGLVAMAGFGTVLDQPIHDAFSARIMNTHPSLLPAFPGWHAVRDALASGAKKTGCTVHVATLEMDEGPILAQQSVVVEESDTEDSLHERIKQIERTLYPETIERALLHLGAGESLLTMQPLLEGDRG
jgi:phosphoribosylglycinamide formyltransferase-1